MPGGMIAPGIEISVIPAARGSVIVVPLTVIAETAPEPSPPQNLVPAIVIVLAVVLGNVPKGVTAETVGASVEIVTRLEPVPVPPTVVTRIL